jgi:hypothetical protein
MVATFIFYMIYLLTLLMLAVYAVSVYKKVPRAFHPMLIFLVATFVMETFAFINANSDLEHRNLISFQYL